MRLRRFSAALCITLLAACQPVGPDRPHTTVGPDLTKLRSEFNADSGMARVVMLVAAT